MCAFEEEINKKKTHFLFSSFFLCMDIVTCPLLEGDMIIPLYTSFNLEQWNERFRKVGEIWLLKLPQGGIVLKYLTGTTGGIVMQLILGCNSKTTVMFV